ncbi:MAG: hypothetical protein J0H54_05220 [Rhizobiales bacterium]|nr:hypothetical protein [Hyphomicrobiales bacterium]
MTGPIEATVTAVAAQKGVRLGPLVIVARVQHAAPAPPRFGETAPNPRHGDRQHDHRDAGQQANGNI